MVSNRTKPTILKDKNIEEVRPKEGASEQKRVSDRFSLIIFAATLVLIALVAIPYGTVEPWWEALFACAVFALTALALIEGLLHNYRGNAGPRFSLLLPMLALALFALVQSMPFTDRGAISADPYETGLFVQHLLALALCGWLLSRYAINSRRLLALILTIIGIGVVCAAFGLVRQVSQGNSPGFLLPYLSPGGSYAQFISRNHFAFLMEMALGLVLGLVVGGGVRRDHILVYLIAAMIMWMALVLSLSRGGVLSMFCQLIFLAILFNPARHRTSNSKESIHRLDKLWHSSHSLVLRAVLILCLTILVGIGVVWIGGEPILSRFEAAPAAWSEQGSKQRMNTSRRDIWRTTIKLIEDHPFTGIGFGGYWIAIASYHDASGKYTPQEAHNDYLELVASGGLVGLLLGIWFFKLFIRRASQTLRSLDAFRSAACLGALTGIFGVAVHSIVDFGLHITINALVFTAILVIATVEIHDTSEQGPEKLTLG